MLTSCSLWTNQKASISQREASHVTGGRVLRLPPRRCFWIAWLWRWWWGLTALESSGPCNNQRDCSWQASTPRALHRLWTETLLWLPMKEACLLPLEPEGWPQVCQTHRGLERCSLGPRQLDAVFTCSLLLATPCWHFLERSLDTHLEPQFLWLPPWGHLQMARLWQPVSLPLVDCMYLQTLKAAAWRYEFQIACI